MSTEPWLTVKDVARILGVHRDDVYRLIASGEIPAMRLGARRWRVPPSALDGMGHVTPRPRRASTPEQPLDEPEPARSQRPARPAQASSLSKMTMKDFYR